MDAAWGQVGRILEANRHIRQAQLALQVSSMWYDRHILPMASVNLEKALIFTAPVHSRIVTQKFTVRYQMENSVVPPALLSTAARKVLRPGGRLMRYSTPRGQRPAETLLNTLMRVVVSADRRAYLWEYKWNDFADALMEARCR
jgi:hypothetical protein